MPRCRKEGRGSVLANKHSTRNKGLLSPYSLTVELLSLPRWLVEEQSRQLNTCIGIAGSCR